MCVKIWVSYIFGESCTNILHTSRNFFRAARKKTLFSVVKLTHIILYNIQILIYIYNFYISHHIYIYIYYTLRKIYQNYFLLLPTIFKSCFNLFKTCDSLISKKDLPSPFAALSAPASTIGLPGGRTS